ncbi:DUF6660 family protein [Larkinella sp. VNQ87]|uniref:DUF6660 family protein n=1 Tax=Larkinella sp. VNQ87 TaxID=3400921 RepID=UPI003C0D6192
MKSLICLVLSVHLLVLSVWPCADGCLKLRADKQTTVTLTTDDHAHDGADPDLCSPFCGCACCGTVLAAGPVFQFAFASVSFLSARYTNFVPTLPTAPVSYWQPPQIG